jgi:Bacterial regulatory proteins, tetR family
MPKTAQTRARILDAALALFNEHGTAAFSTNHVAAATSVSWTRCWVNCSRRVSRSRKAEEWHCLPSTLSSGSEPAQLT